jgi:type I restriction enzyme, S subunit
MQLIDVCELIVDCEHKTAPIQDSGYPSIRTPNIGRGFFLLDGVNRVSEETYRLWTKRAVPGAGDLIMAREAPVGNVAMIPEGLQPCLGQRTLLIRPNRSKIEPAYLAYLLLGDDVQGRIKGMTSGATVPHLNMKDVRSLELPHILPLAVQRRVVGILSAYDDLIENSRRRVRLLEEMTRALYREWFVYYRFPGHEKLAVGESPKGWKGHFGDLATIDRQSINPFDFPGERFEHFSIPAFDDGCEPAVELGGTIRSVKYCIDDSYVLLSKLNPSIPRVWLPAPCGQYRPITSTEFLCLRPLPGVTREFLYAKLRSEEFAGQFNGLAIGTSTSHQRVKPENLLAMPSTVPARPVIAQFTQLVAPMLAMSQRLRATMLNLRGARDLLLPRLITGSIKLDDIIRSKRVVRRSDADACVRSRPEE